MDQSNNTCIADYFQNNFPMKQVRRQMYSKANIYSQIPELIFRFSDLLSDKIYTDLKECVESFEGNVKWTIFQSFYGRKVRNYSLVPVEFYLLNKYMFEKEQVIAARNYFTESEYKEICEQSVTDIPKLCEYIQLNFQWQDGYRLL